MHLAKVELREFDVYQAARQLGCLVAVMVNGLVFSGTQASGTVDRAVQVLRVVPVTSFQVANAGDKQEAAKGCQGFYTTSVCTANH